MRASVDIIVIAWTTSSAFFEASEPMRLITIIAIGIHELNPNHYSLGH
jgi:hypothetical protein